MKSIELFCLINGWGLMILIGFILPSFSQPTIWYGLGIGLGLIMRPTIGLTVCLIKDKIIKMGKT